MAGALAALTIGPLDPGGIDGVLADLRTFSALGLHGAAVVTSAGEIELAAPAVAAQLEATFASMRVDAVKLTCPAHAAVLDTIATSLLEHEVANLVLDPAAAAYDAGALAVLKSRLLPVTRVFLPNVREAAAMTGMPVDTWEDMREAAVMLQALGPANVVIKGGKREGDHVTDLLFDGKDFRDLTAERTPLADVRGAGTTFAATVAAGLAKQETVQFAVASAKAYVTKALQSTYELGDAPALHHFYRYWRPSTR
jgi:hydroxymethylpyrimidine/phosphomethylpyrimidine kinase